jgi:hypothetical protein
MAREGRFPLAARTKAASAVWRPGTGRLKFVHYVVGGYRLMTVSNFTMRCLFSSRLVVSACSSRFSSSARKSVIRSMVIAPWFLNLTACQPHQLRSEPRNGQDYVSIITAAVLKV